MSESRRIAADQLAEVVGPRTRGGWTPAGTAAERRANHGINGTARGRRSRRRLIDAARRVFERVGYIDATIDDIITEAGVARGSFYTYFPDKLSVFQIVALEATDAARRASAPESSTPGLDPVQRLEAANRRYIETYRRHAKIFGLIEQVATVCPTVQAIRRQWRVESVERVTASIERWQRRGLADPALESAATTAALLVSMTGNFCYWWLVGGEKHDDEKAAAELTKMWVRVTGLRKRPRPSWLNGTRARR
jgi:AcrR family transcriptional regulator